VSRTNLVLVFLSSCALAGLAAQQTGPDINVVKSIRSVTVDAVRMVEIELQSSRPFPVRDQIVILRIGKTDVQRSRPPTDGSLNTLIFILTPAAFAQLVDGDAMSVRYGLEHSDDPVTQPGGSNARWDFGSLNKAMLTP
jgi:hypothetical protein